MNIQDAMFNIIKRDEEVMQDDPHYCQDDSSIGVFHDYLTKKGYKPYLDWCESKDKKESEYKAKEKSVKGFLDSTYSASLNLFNHLTPNEINEIMK